MGNDSAKNSKPQVENESISFLRKDLLDNINKLGENHIDVANCYDKLSEKQVEFSLFQDAINSQNHSLKIKLGLLGLNNRQTSDSYYYLGIIYQSLNEI